MPLGVISSCSMGSTTTRLPKGLKLMDIATSYKKVDKDWLTDCGLALS
jgi:hypothetical protein